MSRSLFSFRFPLFAAVFVLFAAVSALFALPAQAADPQHTIKDASYAAQYVGQSEGDPVRIEVGQTKTINFQFKNVGSATWKASGSRYISGFTIEERYRDSAFASDNWRSSYQTASIIKDTAPGEIATLPLTITAQKVGTYKEEFYLAAYSHTWMKGGYFYLEIEVVPATKAAEPVPSEEVVPAQAATAKMVLQSKKDVSVVGGTPVKMVLVYQNTGETPWTDVAIVAPEQTSLAAVGASTRVAHESWKSATTVRLASATVAPGGYLRETFYFRAPPKVGNYEATFFIQVDGDILEESAATISVDVTSNAPSGYVEPDFSDSSSAAPTDSFDIDLGAEPRIRVGVFRMKPSDDKEVRFLSDKPYYVYAGGAKKGTLPAGTKATMNYSGGTYFFAAPDIIFETSAYVRLAPVDDPHAVFSLPNKDRLVSWKGNVNFNTYRGAMEFRRTDDGNNNVYIINDLLMEDYVAGNAETSAIGPMEYIKAIHTAYRTYAYYIMTHTSKHDERYFDVFAHTGDQLYLGYESEKLMPRVVEAAKATRGMMIAYDNAIVITPYFGNSDGRTRSWQEVWGGSAKPWLVPVVAPYDKRDGKSMYGHGVGMSARDAAYMAEEEGVSYIEILKHYYTGVQIGQAYK